MVLRFVVILCCIKLISSFVSYQPEQVHLSYGGNPYEIVVMWSTTNQTNESVVEYGIGGLIKQATGLSTLFVSGDNETRSQYIHRVTLLQLTPRSKYVYHCGSDQGWSDLFWFMTSSDESTWTPQLAIFGDLGNENARSLPHLQEEVQRGMYDAILHVGDFAYDMDSENGLIGDEFMKQIQPISAYVPYMTCPGNHEEAYNFSNYRARFNMPGNSEGLWYSFNMGPVHFISVSTEVYYFLEYGLKLVTKQYAWLEQDLQEATSPENRSVRPWIVMYGHRPMYCSNTGDDDCTHYGTYTRVGLPFLHWFGMEKLLYDYGVDLVIWAHEHSYERLWPLYDYRVHNGSYEEPYRDPGAPVHIISGSAGCKEDTSPFRGDLPYWSAFRSTDYGYMRMRIFNKTHLYMEQISVDKEGEVIDHIWLIKNSHGSYA
ncbi:Acid phosphatase type 7 [Cryptotermes secundus]|uniref:Purple acid phosphatase n=1 Tax=Cryptotermes secundus TaxID=105785 RepID=A0A2J7QLU3_9NEOP|nr:acid phosphatase type 7 [Cryptotermes secundus]XP_023711631.1 acid phosphatase type 7 [Cryptotermes secundus]XP_023711632.1 acid phosphatase type 7 [Cryptotermes secundus]PNF29564.1 Acid phosphatase type 7 [Cryptotermes secundus]PNF29565.1 Acid phosphatase type 7 [Cryptotermes secundus]PNF29566.1 Acid phosphatase type 7 [Cryptotermes secundus]PNF29567.1 Acid phosphatase type 7 [Cryptotermes secundus]